MRFIDVRPFLRICLVILIAGFLLQCGKSEKSEPSPRGFLEDDIRIPLGWSGLEDWDQSSLEIQ